MLSYVLLTNRNPWLLDIIKSCLQRDPSLRPSIDGEDGLLSHPFLQPQGPRAMSLYKQMAVDNEIMKEVIKQIHENAKDKRWEEETIIPLVTQVSEMNMISKEIGIGHSMCKK